MINSITYAILEITKEDYYFCFQYCNGLYSFNLMSFELKYMFPIVLLLDHTQILAQWVSLILFRVECVQQALYTHSHLFWDHLGLKKVLKAESASHIFKLPESEGQQFLRFDNSLIIIIMLT